MIPTMMTMGPVFGHTRFFTPNFYRGFISCNVTRWHFIVVMGPVSESNAGCREARRIVQRRGQIRTCARPSIVGSVPDRSSRRRGGKGKMIKGALKGMKSGMKGMKKWAKGGKGKHFKTLSKGELSRIKDSGGHTSRGADTTTHSSAPC